MKRILSATLILSSYIAIICNRLFNPAMTETQLFINFWWAYGIATICIVAGLVMLDAFKKG